MVSLSRRAMVGLVAACFVTGCGPGTPATGDRAQVPADYKEKEAKIVEGFKSSYLEKMKAAGKEKRIPPQLKDQEPKVK